MSNKYITIGLVMCLCVALATAATAGKDAVKVPLKFYIFKEECYDKFIKQDFSDIDCIKFTISKGIGMAIVCGSAILKVP